MERGVDLKGAISANVLNMVGVGPFLTIPLALAAMGGPQAMLGWILGALIALCDGLVWAELGSAMPQSGGPYHYLLEAFGPFSFGRLASFLFLWQIVLIGPISIASGAVGFAQYAKYLVPSLHGWWLAALAAAVCLLNMLLLLRPIRSINGLSITIAAIVLATTGWILVSGVFHFHPSIAFDFPAGAFHLSAQILRWAGRRDAYRGLRLRRLLQRLPDRRRGAESAQDDSLFDSSLYPVGRRTLPDHEHVDSRRGPLARSDALGRHCGVVY